MTMHEKLQVHYVPALSKHEKLQLMNVKQAWIGINSGKRTIFDRFLAKKIVCAQKTTGFVRWKPKQSLC